MSFRVPGSMLDQMYPAARVGDRYFLGSGTSQAAAVVTGFTAAILSRDPSLTPDQVKYLFMLEAKDLKQAASYINGKIQPKEVARNLKEAAKAPIQQWTPALSSSDIGLAAPNGTSWSGGGWSGTSWSGGTWWGVSWSGVSWSGVSWSGTSWSGVSWSGVSWSGGTWSGTSWSGTSWSGVSWSGDIWSTIGWD